MTTTYYFRVADFRFSVCLPASCDVGRLLPSFHDFRETGPSMEKTLFHLTTVPSGQLPAPGSGQLIEQTDNDMGHLVLYALRDGYYIEITSNGRLHRMAATDDFSVIDADLQWDDPQAGSALSSLIRTAYAQAILYHNAISIHASAVHNNGRAYLFMGKSGTGKSTHSALWMEHIPGTELLNDDNPTIRIWEGKAYAYGTPWSGKTACYKNQAFPHRRNGTTETGTGEPLRQARGHRRLHSPLPRMLGHHPRRAPPQQALRHPHLPGRESNGGDNGLPARQRGGADMPRRTDEQIQKQINLFFNHE